MLDPLNVIVASAFLFLPSGCSYFIQKCNTILLILVSFSYRFVFTGYSLMTFLFRKVFASLLNKWLNELFSAARSNFPHSSEGGVLIKSSSGFLTPLI